MRFESESYHFHSWKCIWKCHLPEWQPFCPGGDGLTYNIQHTDTAVSWGVKWLINSLLYGWLAGEICVGKGCHSANYTLYSVLPIYRGHIYRGRMLDPIFWPPISLISRTWRPRARFLAKSRQFLGPRSWETVFREICSPRLPLIRLTGDNFSRNLLWASLAYLWNAGGNTCCAMASYGRRIIDTSIVSQRRVLLIWCPCKSVPQTADQGKTNVFLIKSSLTTCWHPRPQQIKC